ncbi:hypothetical protein [Mycobacterium intracellulare]|uniref:Transmembrane protein n=1 Tax=Mycobacterium intracellulare (strain ATCC 13950 / DSM 43223 / JCM 6384 / NCTC 13025 / 3600) TaxID=487521 RepID=H8ITI6_MYCIA|nr:hypothetical protein [Mycobacterium intracellulare]AFC45740.1 hypothetical protein OCU_45210 [Mycobacterium intracellulare ATCC 13950]AFC50912.1 hypothetical protein OCO_45490 [Mycobacterium intracellulare MOTT-02]ASQ88417.1 hypothetical protein CE197_24555 [Mycobacterium intracellulare subsp. chimaera]ETZ32147.1 hypothetical protein L843_4857 [Mycobacterium intracellulare MIN_061107_1834]MCA2250058.1 hypothetical protein [Mycobacterium intracellulare]
MTGPHSETESPGTRPISVAELLARNGTIGAPAVTRRRRRRRGDSDAVTVAELTGEIPVVRDDDDAEHGATDTIEAVEPADSPTEDVAAEPVTEDKPKTPYWSEPEPRWPKSPPQPKRVPGPERSAYPRPLANGTARPEEPSGAEDMSPDPMDHYADIPVDVMDSDVREAEPALEDSAYVRSYLRSSGSLDEDLDEDGDAARAGSLDTGLLGLEDEDAHAEGADAHPAEGRLDALWRGAVVVLQSILAVAFGGGLFVAFDQLWRWNSIVALVLSVLVILGLVVGVRVVRKTEDIASTLIAVAVGALITLGPLALSLQSG